MVVETIQLASEQQRGVRVTTQKTIDELRTGFQDPPTGSAPMMRWWWFGPSVDRAEIDHLRKLARERC